MEVTIADYHLNSQTLSLSRPLLRISLGTQLMTIHMIFFIFRKDRQGKRGGGVLMAIKSCFSCTRRVDLEVDAECCFVI